MTPAGRTTKATEIANARAFFDIASDIRLDRTTLEQDIRADEKRAEVRSKVKFFFSQSNLSLSRSYTFVYTFANENGTWRIDGMIIEQEGP